MARKLTVSEAETLGFSTPNLDDSNEDHLNEFLAAYLTLHTYTHLKLKSMKLRLQGEIEKAQFIEIGMENLYQSLPKWARW